MDLCTNLGGMLPGMRCYRVTNFWGCGLVLHVVYQQLVIFGVCFGWEGVGWEGVGWGCAVFPGNLDCEMNGGCLWYLAGCGEGCDLRMRSRIYGIGRGKKGKHVRYDARGTLLN